jgi:hypothetical protein
LLSSISLLLKRDEVREKIVKIAVVDNKEEE